MVVWKLVYTMHCIKKYFSIKFHIKFELQDIKSQLSKKSELCDNNDLFHFLFCGAKQLHNQQCFAILKFQTTTHTNTQHNSSHVYLSHKSFICFIRLSIQRMCCIGSFFMIHISNSNDIIIIYYIIYTVHHKMAPTPLSEHVSI